jgi:DNA-binding transcriptional ArsR family regulator
VREHVVTSLTKNFVKAMLHPMLDLEILDQPAAAQLALDPIKAGLLAELRTPASAAILAERVGLSRQKVNYHLRALEERGLVTPVEERRWGGIRERIVRASAGSYVVSPAALGPIASDPATHTDRLSASYLLALAARAVREVGALWHRARTTRKRLATLSLDTTIRFRTPADRAAFTDELGRAVAALVARYHHEPDGSDSTERGRLHRLVAFAYPAPDPDRR